MNLRLSNLILLQVVFLCSSCQLLLRNATSRDADFTPLDKKITAVSQSMTNLTKLTDLDIGMFVSKQFIYQQIKNAVDSLNRSGWNNEYVDSIEIFFSEGGLAMENESIHMSFTTTFHINSRISLVKNISTQFWASVPISSSNDTLFLYPNFDSFRIVKKGFEGKKLCKNFGEKKDIIFTLFGLFNGHLNKLLGVKPISLPLDISIIEEKPVKELFSSSPNQTIVSDDTLKTNVRLNNISVHTEPSGLYVMADLLIGDPAQSGLKKESLTMRVQKENDPVFLVSNTSELRQLDRYSQSSFSSKNLGKRVRSINDSDGATYHRPIIYTGSSVRPSSMRTELKADSITDENDWEALLREVTRYIEDQKLKKKRLSEVLVSYDSLFKRYWYQNFDSIKGESISIYTQKSFVAELFNYSMNRIDFKVIATNRSNTSFSEQNIRVGHTTIVDNCATIRDRHCSKDRCYLRSCCSCKWYKPHCCICNAAMVVPYLGCLTHAEAKYLACKAGNYGDYLWCEAKVLTGKLFNELAKVGDIEGSVNANGTIRIDYNSFYLSPDLTSLYFDSWVSGKGNANIDLTYDPEGLVGYLLCPGPIPRRFNKNFNINAITQELDIKGSIDHENSSTGLKLNITTESENIFLLITPPPTVSIFTDPIWTFSCPIAVFGITFGNFAAAFFGNDDLKKKALAALTGMYDYQLDPMKFDFPIRPIEVKPSDYTPGITLTPSWQTKTISFKAE